MKKNNDEDDDDNDNVATTKTILCDTNDDKIKTMQSLQCNCYIIADTYDEYCHSGDIPSFLGLSI